MGEDITTWLRGSCGDCTTDYGGIVPCSRCQQEHEVAEEIERLRLLAQCCERDHNYDGNCDRHPKGLRGEIERLRGAMAADDTRLRAAAERVNVYFGCDSAARMADEIERLTGLISRLRRGLHQIAYEHCVGEEAAQQIAIDTLAGESDTDTD